MRALALSAVFTVLVAGCAGLQRGGSTATAELKNPQGQAAGTARLTEVSGGVRILVEVRDLPPGEKGVHLHEVGKCDGPAFTSAGGHFNPGKKQHGLQNPAGPHAGDMPNIRIEANGSGRLETMNERITLGSGPTSLFDGDGSAIVVHAAADDLKTDPTGNSGARLLCGVIVKQ